MEHTKQLALARRSLEHIAHRTTDRDAHPTTVAVDTYLDPKRYERELAALFRGAPIVVGHVSQLVSPGDRITHEASGVPLLVVRGDDGELGAFLNEAGGLVRVPVGEAGGLVWARATPATSPEDAKLDASAYLGPLEDDLVRFGVPTSHVYKPRSSDREMNWKVSIDIFLETYHLRPTHKNTIYPLFFDNLGLVDRFSPHIRTVLPKRTLRSIASESDEVLGSTLRQHANIVYLLFPNTIVLILGDHVTVTSMWPVGIGRTRFAKYMLIPEPAEAEQAVAYWELNDSILVTATEEDLVLGEAIQSGLASGANKELVFGAFEHALAYFHAEIDKRLDREVTK